MHLWYLSPKFLINTTYDTRLPIEDSLQLQQIKQLIRSRIDCIRHIKCAVAVEDIRRDDRPGVYGRGKIWRNAQPISPVLRTVRAAEDRIRPNDFRASDERCGGDA